MKPKGGRELKKPRFAIKTRDWEVVVQPEDVATWFISVVALIAAVTFSLLLLQGMMNEAMMAFSFLTGMGVTEGLRHFLKNTKPHKKRARRR